MLEENQKKIDAIRLENGLMLEWFDCSRKIAGDRWLVSILARIEIPISMFENDTSGFDTDEARSLLGEQVVFKQKMDRNFIDEKEKDALFKEMYQSFSKNTLAYLSHPEFAKRFVFRQFHSSKKKKNWYQEAAD